MRKKVKIICVFNFPSHYRQNIYMKMEKELGCQFYFGNIEGANIKKLDFNNFECEIKEFKTLKMFHNFNWIAGSTFLSFKPNSIYILTGDPYCLSNWVILFLNRFLLKKTYLWTHGWYGNEGFVKRIIKKIFFNLSDGIFLYGNYAKGLMIKEGFDENKLHVIYNSLDYERQLKIRENLKVSNIYKDHFKNEYPTLIFIGRLTKVKKLEQILELQKKIRNKGIEVNVVFVGEGEEKENLENLAISNGLKNIWFYGPCYKEEVIGELIYNATACVSPGNVGLTAIHVLMYGTPIVTHNNYPYQMPEFEAIEDGVTGIFFKEDNIDDMVNKMEILLLVINKGKIKSENCYKKIDNYFNPNYQVKIFKEVML